MEAQAKLGEFLKKSVTRLTLKGYGYGWRDWQGYLKSDAVEGEFNPYPRGVSKEGKVMLLSGVFLARYDMGRREKQAKALREMVSVERVLACEVQAVHQKTRKIRTTKVIGRRSAEEAQLLEDLFKWVVVLGIRCGDNLFSRWACDKKSKVWRNK